MFPFLFLATISLLFLLFVGIATIVLRREMASADKIVWRGDDNRRAGGSPIDFPGESLYFWAKDTAAAIANRFLAKPLTKELPVELARELHADMTSAMVPLGTVADEVDEVACPDDGLGMVGLTAPEALEIADYVNKNLPVSEKNRMLDLARANSLRLDATGGIAFDYPQLPCPLQGSNHVCLAYASRPLRCRPFHAAEAWRQRGVKRRMDEVRDREEILVAQGAEAGLREALDENGRNAEVYELNSALIAALETPKAAERWANGEEIFHWCRRCH